MLENDRIETVSTEVTSIRRQNNIEKTRGKLIHILSILKVESTSKFPRRIDVIISTWIRLSKSMKSRRTFHVEFRRQIGDESIKMFPLGRYQSVGHH